MNHIISILTSFILTCIIEIVVLFIIKEKRKEIYLFSIFINLFTNIPLNIFILNYSFSSIPSYFLIVLLLELVIIIIEAMLYYLIFKNVIKGLKYSLILNISSYLIGLIISLIISIF